MIKFFKRIIAKLFIPYRLRFFNRYARLYTRLASMLLNGIKRLSTEEQTAFNDAMKDADFPTLNSANKILEKGQKVVDNA